MSEWSMVRFEDLADSSKSAFSKPYGSAILKEDYLPRGVPVVRGVNLRNGIFFDDDFVFISEVKADRMPGANLTSGDLVFTHRGTIGQVSMIPWNRKHNRYVLSTSHVKARLNPKRAVPEFYFYYFLSPQGQAELLKNISTVGVPGLAQPVATIKALSVPHPPLATQRAIAQVLGVLDDKITVNNRIASTAHGLGQALSASAHKTAELVKLSEISNITMGSSPPGESYNEGEFGMPFYQGTRDFGDRFPGLRVWCTSPVRTASSGSCLVSVRAPVGRVNVARKLCCIGRGLAAVQSKFGTPSVLFHELAAASDVWLPFESEGTVFGAINKQQLANIEIPALGAQSARALENVLMPLDQRVASASDENCALVELRNTLLPKLMSGQIRVRDAEKVVEDVT